jgi:hypothetical protein
MKFMQENVVGTAHLIHNSMNDLTRAINAAQTTLYNSINAFNALSFNKFVKNVFNSYPNHCRKSKRLQRLQGQLRKSKTI